MRFFGFCCVLATSTVLGACEGPADGDAQGEGEGEGEGEEGFLCTTDTSIVACDPVFDDSLCPTTFPFGGTPCDVHNLVCTWCNINGGGATLALWCDEAGDPPLWLEPSSCIEED